MKTRALLLMAFILTLAAPAGAQLVISQPLRTYQVSDVVASLDVTTTGQRLAVACPQMGYVFNLDTGYLVRMFKMRTMADQYIPDAWNYGIVRFWPDDNSVLFNFGFQKSVSNGFTVGALPVGEGAFAISHDRRTIASCGEYIRVLTWKNSKINTNAFGQYGYDRCAIDISPDNSKVATGNNHGVLKLWNSNSAEKDPPLLAIAAHGEEITSVQFNPVDGNQVLTASTDGTARLWDLAQKKMIRQFTAQTGALYCAVFSPNGKFILTGGANDKGEGRARLWDTATGKRSVVYFGHSQPVTCAAFTLEREQNPDRRARPHRAALAGAVAVNPKKFDGDFARSALECGGLTERG